MESIRIVTRALLMTLLVHSSWVSANIIDPPPPPPPVPTPSPTSVPPVGPVAPPIADCVALVDSVKFPEGTLFNFSLVNSVEEFRYYAGIRTEYQKNLKKLYNSCQAVKSLERTLETFRSILANLLGNGLRQNPTVPGAELYQRLIAEFENRINNILNTTIPNLIAAINGLKAILANLIQDGEQQPGAFIVTGPVSPVKTQTPVATWGVSANATSYDVVLATDALCNDTVQQAQGILNNEFQFSAIIEGEYYVCVTARNGAGSATNGNNFSFIYDVTPPEAFSILSPAGVVNVDAPTAAWEVAIDASSYDVIVSDVEDCSNVVQNHLGVTEASIALDQLEEGSYYLCVTAADNAENFRAASNNGLAFEVQLISGNPRVVFVTSSIAIANGLDIFPPIYPSFGNIEGADWNCSVAAAQAGLVQDWDQISLPFKAIMSDAQNSAVSRLVIDGPVVTVTGETVATSAADLWDGQILRPISINEFGLDMSNDSIFQVWTGHGISGEAGSSCNSWNSTSSSAIVGNLSRTDTAWTSYQLKQCGSSARLYCIDQR